MIRFNPEPNVAMVAREDGRYVRYEDAQAWKDAVIEACIASCIDWDENDPMKTLHNLICWEVKIALDPAVSNEAAALIQRGRDEAKE
jgi:hypothetical protein